MSVPTAGTVELGTELPPLTARIRRSDLVRYAGASGDFNPIHWNPRVAREVGLPDVIAHGMYTMALGARMLTDWLVDPTRLVEYSVRFVRPVVVPDTDEGVEVRFGGKVVDKRDDGLYRVDVTAECGGEKVFGAARAFVRLD
ncbi:MaoC/PaaZ C-terminal domain-containing protein [Thermasporomyces composti]|jgi:acyl dehydratase|uniref:Acyl dehydratase n=1 Tax=Thermasporomyces composti TaxID=696763 RepID=A0A3D9V705_THECX|nr:MaoC/PaaZ C-terminal domain-containing protein [Thermasporomyces composti]REF37287.1 acyl dehydratase [Thermasporomyces composti]